MRILRWQTFPFQPRVLHILGDDPAHLGDRVFRMRIYGSECEDEGACTKRLCI